jgi:ribosomal-protein-alanine N-acetyltransferase
VSAELRPAASDDLAAIAAIARESFADPWSPASFAGMLGGARTRMMVVSDAAKVVGYSVLLLAPPDADLADLAVDVAARGKGYGRMLLEGVLATAQAEGVINVYLEVRESNARAVALYERAGFIECGKRRRYYRAPVEDARVYRKLVKSQ